MIRNRATIVGAAIAVAAVSVTLAACGGSSDSADSTTTAAAAATTETTAGTTTAPATTTTPSKTTVVPVVLGKPDEYSLVPARTSVAAGKVTFVVTNQGAMMHEMVVVPAPDGAAALKEPDGTASEAGSPGEVADLAAGANGRLTVTLPAGKYVLLCNLPGHFAGGMWANFTVT